MPKASHTPLLTFAHLSSVKGIVLALGAVRCLLKAGYDVTLDIAGKGPLRTHLCNEIERLGLAERVHLLGMIPREELMALHGQADLFVFPSLHDSSGTVVLESLSRGLPVVCLDLGGPKNYVTAECGVVVSTHELLRSQVEQGLADAIAAVIDDPERLRRMSAEAFRQATMQTWGVQVNRAYETIEQKLSWA